MTYVEKVRADLKEKYKYRIELHAHTSPVSPCSEIKPEDVVKNFYESGYHGIAITNHFFPHLLKCKNVDEYVERYKRDFDIAFETGEKLGIKVYRGAELRFPNENNNDYLLFGYDFDEIKEIYGYLDKTLEEFVKNYKKDKMFILQAHPFRDDMFRADVNLIDAVEAFNMHPNHNGRIALAAKFAEENGKIITAGTDYHHLGHENLCATRMQVLPENTAELIKVIKSNDFIVDMSGKLVI